jgi:hypothetical protein
MAVVMSKAPSIFGKVGLRIDKKKERNPLQIGAHVGCTILWGGLRIGLGPGNENRGGVATWL